MPAYLHKSSNSKLTADFIRKSERWIKSVQVYDTEMYEVKQEKTTEMTNNKKMWSIVDILAYRRYGDR